jgi:hypothetical protein
LAYLMGQVLPGPQYGNADFEAPRVERSSGKIK